jgi:thiol:disulfide interchange protein
MYSAGVGAGGQLPAFSREFSADRDPFADARAAIALAEQTQRRILIEVGGEWCSWCHALNRLFRENPPLERTLRNNFVVLKVNVSSDNDNADFMAGMPELAGYPKLFVSRANGSIIHVQDPATLVREGAYDPELVLTFLKRWANPGGAR